jgi:hypothetical protein
MKIYLPTLKNRRHGVALILTVLFLVFVAVFLASYLFLAQGEYLAVTRSQTWNISLALAEAGVEDALAFINQNAGSSGAITNWTVVATGQGWANTVNTSSNQVFYLAARSPDTNLGYYSVYVTNFLSGSTNGPAILSIGTARWKETGGPKSGSNSVMLSFKGNPSRKIYVKTTGITQLGGGIVAYAGMDFKGNNVTIDSFDSTTNTHSIWQTLWRYQGAYYGYWSNSLSIDTNFLPSRTANVLVATDGNVINVGNANIAGYVATAPGGTVNINNNGTVGTLYWVYHNSGIQEGHSRDDMNQTFFSKSLPIPTNAAQATWWPVPAISTNIEGVSYNYMITNRLANSNRVYYAMPSLSSSIYINASNVVLYLTNGLSYSGSKTFTLNTNADVELWSTGNIDAGGSAVINNYTLNGHAFSIYDVSGHPITIKLSGNGMGTGYIYAPSASLTFSGGGSGTYDVVGAIFCHDITINGHYNFHFDESLSKSLPTDQFTLSSWQEVP